MSYVTPLGGSVELELSVTGTAPGGDVNLEFGIVDADIRQAGGFQSQGVGSAKIRLKSSFIAVKGFDCLSFAKPTAEPDTPKIYAQGIDSTISVGQPQAKWTKYIEPKGIEQIYSMPAVVRIRLAGGYNSPPGSSVTLNWDGSQYSPAPGSSVSLEFGAAGYARVLGATAGDTLRVGFASVLTPEGIRPVGFGPTSALGTPDIEGSVRRIRLDIGIPVPFEQVSKPNLTNSALAIKPNGFNDSLYGLHSVELYRKYIYPSNVLGSTFGTQYVSGGIKTVSPAGIVGGPFGLVTLLNTTANQEVRPNGRSELELGSHSVSPRTIFITGFLAGQLGYPLIQPNPSPKGFVTDGYGTPEVIYKTRWVKPASVYDFNPGYPVVRDKAQTVLHKSSPVTAVFGDTSARLKNFFIRPSGHHSLEFSSWAELRNLNRYVSADGFAQWSFGDNSIRNKWPTVAPVGWESTAFGNCGVGWRTRSIIPTGVIAPFNQVTKPSLWQTPSLKPLGIQPPTISRPFVWPAIRIIEQLGADMLRAGVPTVDFAYRFVRLEGDGVDGASYGLTRIETSTRHLEQKGSAFDAYGRPWVSFGQRRIEPESIWFNFATNHMVGGLRFIGPDGFDAARFGERIIPESQSLYTRGFAGTFGTAKLLNQKLFVKPASITTYSADTMRFGIGRLWNLIQAITQDYDEDSDLTPPEWPQWTAIANRNRYVRTIGANASAVARPYIENGARGIYPVGAAPAWVGSVAHSSMIAYRIRFLPVEGLEQPYITSWSRVYNSAFPLKPAGLMATLTGTARIQNTRRIYERVGNFDSAVLGYPFVADRIRGIEFERRYTIAPPVVPLPIIDLYSRPVEPKGFESTTSQIGRASLSIHWNIIAPRWTLQNLYGSPALHNVTPEVATRGRNAEDFGITAVRLEWRRVVTEETFTQAFGRAMIADTKRFIFLSGMKAWAFGDKLKVIKTGAPPYSLQNITLSNERNTEENPVDGGGIYPPGEPGNAKPPHSQQIGRPILNQQVIYVIEEYAQTKTGTPTISANSIRVQPGYGEYLMGEPFIDLRVRVLLVDKFPEGEVFDPPKGIRISPHTIYAVKEAPQQAKINHPVNNLHYVGEVIDSYPPGERFGRQRIENRHRTIKPSGVVWREQDRMSRPKIANKRTVVDLKGFIALRFGWPTVPGDQSITLFSSIFDTGYGKPAVSRPPYVGPSYIKPTGMVENPSKLSRVEHFNRALSTNGFDSMRMGTKLGGDKPHQWQGLRVGELVPTVPDTFCSEVFGQSWVSLRVRDVSIQGFDSFMCEEDPNMFMERMRVKHAQSQQPPTMRITTIGAEHSVIGPASVIPMLHFIRPDGNSDQHRKGAW